MSRIEKILAGVVIFAGGCIFVVSRCPACSERLKRSFRLKMMTKMPKMMENKLSRMSEDNRKEMLTECRGMLDKMEEKFL